MKTNRYSGFRFGDKVAYADSSGERVFAYFLTRIVRHSGDVRVKDCYISNYDPHIDEYTATLGRMPFNSHRLRLIVERMVLIETA